MNHISGTTTMILVFNFFFMSNLIAQNVELHVGTNKTKYFSIIDDSPNKGQYLSSDNNIGLAINVGMQTKDDRFLFLINYESYQSNLRNGYVFSSSSQGEDFSNKTNLVYLGVEAFLLKKDFFKALRFRLGIEGSYLVYNSHKVITKNDWYIEYTSFGQGELFENVTYSDRTFYKGVKTSIVGMLSSKYAIPDTDYSFKFIYKLRFGFANELSVPWGKGYSLNHILQIGIQKKRKKKALLN